MTEFTRSLAQADQVAAFDYSRHINSPMFEQFSSYLVEKNQTSSSAGTKLTAFAQALNTNDTLFDYLSKNPELELAFARCMRGVSESMKSWVDIYPTESLLVDDDGGSYDEVVVVDIGGGIGQDINAFQRKHKLAMGRLILQDLEKVVEQAKVEPNITVMPHDFFQIQTVKGRVHLQSWDRFRIWSILRTTG